MQNPKLWLEFLSVILCPSGHVGELGLGAGKTSSISTAAWGEAHPGGLKLQPGTREVRVKPTLDSRHNFVYGTALGQHRHKNPALWGKHHVRAQGQAQKGCAASVSSKDHTSWAKNPQGNTRTGFSQSLTFSMLFFKLLLSSARPPERQFGQP